MLDKPQTLELLKHTQTQLQTLEAKLNIPQKTAQLATLNQQMEQTDFWDTPETAQKISQTVAETQKFIEKW